MSPGPEEATERRQESATCIYCLLAKPVGDFDREHIIPEAFGHFAGALTLTTTRVLRVCKSCNGDFGRTIDLTLTRDSLEALLRIRFDLHNPEKLEQYLKTRIQLRLKEKHPLGPLFLDYRIIPPEVLPAPVPTPQARLRLRDGNLLRDQKHKPARPNARLGV